MMIFYAACAATIIGAALYLILSRNLMRMLLGFSLLATGVNQLLFLAGGVSSRQPPIVADGAPHWHCSGVGPVSASPQHCITCMKLVAYPRLEVGRAPAQLTVIPWLTRFFVWLTETVRFLKFS